MKTENLVALDSERLQLDRHTVLETLYERVVRDCNNAQEYISLTEIIGCLETIKLSIFQATHLAVSQKVSNEITKGKTVN